MFGAECVFSLTISARGMARVVRACPCALAPHDSQAFVIRFAILQMNSLRRLSPAANP
jgi:hypothetical protein